MKIQFLSNADLLTRFGKLVQTERKITHLVLRCIAEIDSRRLYLDKAYPSLYEFLVKEFGYSSSAALRRIESARLLRDVPELADKIESGALNLSQLSKVQQAVRTVQKLENRKMPTAEKTELLSRIEYTTQQQTEAILSEALSISLTTEDKERLNRDESVTITITLNKEQMKILKQAQDLISHSVPDGKWADVITYLAQHEIKRRTSTRKSIPQKSTNTLSPSKRKFILKQHKSCQYKDPATGKVCGGTRFLQVDHRHSLWAGGSHDIQNLQILCAEHNRHKYNKETRLNKSSRPLRV